MTQPNRLDTYTYRSLRLVTFEAARMQVVGQDLSLDPEMVAEDPACEMLERQFPLLAAARREKQ
jgi:hypothetical protein